MDAAAGVAGVAGAVAAAQAPVVEHPLSHPVLIRMWQPFRQCRHQVERLLPQRRLLLVRQRQAAPVVAVDAVELTQVQPFRRSVHRDAEVSSSRGIP